MAEDRKFDSLAIVRVFAIDFVSINFETEFGKLPKGRFYVPRSVNGPEVQFWPADLVTDIFGRRSWVLQLFNLLQIIFNGYLFRYQKRYQMVTISLVLVFSFVLQKYVANFRITNTSSQN